MQFHYRVIIMWILTVVMIPTVAFGQSDLCALLVQNALAITDEACVDTGRNQACYGNSLLQATLQADAANVVFNTPGDKVDLTDVQTLRLGSFNADNEEWGVALMRVQANLPETLPGQNVTFVLFGDVEIEDATAPDAPPMQAFFFRSGIGDAPCESAPNSGILIQTPEGVGEINLRVNEVDITLGSTTFLQAQPGDEMIINGLEGNVMASSFDEMENAIPGTRVRVPLDENLMASGPPSPPEPFDEDDVQALPLGNLEREITPPPPFEGDASTAGSATTVSSDIPLTGTWLITYGGDCAAFLSTLSEADRTFHISVSGDANSFTMVAPTGESITLTPNADGTYSVPLPEDSFMNFNSISADLVTGEFGASAQGFSIVCPMTLERLSD